MGVVLLVVCALTWIHRDDLWPPESGAVATEDDPVAQCFAARAADIDGMVAEGTISGDQATLFKSRAEALCQAQAGQAGPPSTE